MKITNEQQINTGTNNASVRDTGFSIKNFNDLTAGDMFKATVTDIQPNSVSLLLENGNTLQAKSLILPNARIGDEALFTVKENFKGQILLEMLRPDGDNPRGGIVKEALASADMPNTEDNAQLVNALIKNQLPIDASTLQKASFFKYFGDGLSVDKIMFLLKENFPAEPATVKGLNGIINNTLNLNENIKSLIVGIFNLDDTAKINLLETIIKPEDIMNKLGLSQNDADTPAQISVRQFLASDFIVPEDIPNENFIEEFINALLDKSSDAAQSRPSAQPGLSRQDLQKHKILGEVISDKLFINLMVNPPTKTLNDYYNDLKQITAALKNNIPPDETGAGQRLLQNADNIMNNLSFANHISNFKQYMHIPFHIHGQANEGQLHIFKKRKGEKDFSQNACVLLSLEYLSLGHLNVFVNKTKNALAIQFKGDNDDALKLIAANSGKLAEALNEKGYSISQLNFGRLTEKLDVTDTIDKQTKEETIKRYAFDMHV